MHQSIDPATRALLESLYATLCGAVVVLARLLGRPSPLASRAERRAARYTGEEARWGHE
jgi:hypothetical protein